MTYRLLLLIDRVRRSQSGQDLIEYALLAGFLAVVMAAVFPQTIGPNISTIYSKIESTMRSSHNIGS